MARPRGEAPLLLLLGGGFGEGVAMRCLEECMGVEAPAETTATPPPPPPRVGGAKPRDGEAVARGDGERRGEGG